jgi:capsule biosynthesis phosphatase
MVALVRYCIDFDETICYTDGTDYKGSIPIPEVINEVRKLKNLGHYIIILTARGSGSGINHEALTRSQLNEWGVPYDELHFSKPFADFYIDDKAISAFAWHEQLGVPESKNRYRVFLDNFFSAASQKVLR